MLKIKLLVLMVFGNSLLFGLKNSNEEASSQLQKTAQNYLQFVHDVGSAGSVKSDDPRICQLFAYNLTKIDNRMTLFENNRELLLPQMKGFEKENNPEATEPDWIINFDDALIIPSVEKNSVIAHFTWSHLNIGRATTMAILQCNEQGQIERIIDVWARIQN